MSKAEGDNCSQKIRIILAEDHHVVRKGILRLIDEQLDMSVVAEAANGHEVLSILKNGIKADILISDINMPDMDGFELFARIKKSKEDIKMIALSMLETEKHIKKAFYSGCSGYLTKSVKPEELLFAIRQVGEGKKYLCTETVDRVINTEDQMIGNDLEISVVPYFTEREIEILGMIAMGMTNLEIGEKVFLSRRTVEGHRQNLIDKTGSKNTAVLIRYAVVHGLV